MGNEGKLLSAIAEMLFNTGAIFSDEEHQPGIASARQSMENVAVAKELQRQQKRKEEMEKWKKFKKFGGLGGGVIGGLVGGLPGALIGAAIPRGYSNVKLGLNPLENLADVVVGGAIDLATGQLLKGIAGQLFGSGGGSVAAKGGSVTAEAGGSVAGEAGGGGTVVSEGLEPIKLNPLKDSPAMTDRLMGHVQDYANYFEKLGSNLVAGGLANQNPFPLGSPPLSSQDLSSTLTNLGQVITTLSEIKDAITGFGEDSDLSSTVTPTTVSGFIPYQLYFALNEEQRRRAEQREAKRQADREYRLKVDQLRVQKEAADKQLQLETAKLVADIAKTSAEPVIDVLKILSQQEFLSKQQEKEFANALELAKQQHELKLEFFKETFPYQKELVLAGKAASGTSELEELNKQLRQMQLEEKKQTEELRNKYQEEVSRLQETVENKGSSNDVLRQALLAYSTAMQAGIKSNAVISELVAMLQSHPQGNDLVKRLMAFTRGLGGLPMTDLISEGLFSIAPEESALETLQKSSSQRQKEETLQTFLNLPQTSPSLTPQPFDIDKELYNDYMRRVESFKSTWGR